LQIADCTERPCVPGPGTCLADLKAKLWVILWVILCELFRGDSAFLCLASIPSNKAFASPPTSVDQLGRSMTMMHGKIAAAAAGLVLTLCAACGTASSPVAPPAAPTAPQDPTLTTTSPAPNTSEVTVTGSADTGSAAPVAGVTVAFKLAADLGSCGTCGLYTSVTDAAGTYSLTLPTGMYDALCAKTGQTCEVMTNPPAATAQVTVDSNGSLNFLVAGSTESPQPQPQPRPTGRSREAAATS
jgi:hypothetical protein